MKFTENQPLDRVSRGALKLCALVEKTYGPNGRHVLLQRKAGNLFSRDGFTISCEIEFEDRLESAGAEIIKELSGKINRKVGDGTTTAILLLGSLLKEGNRLLQAGISSVDLIRGIQSGLEEAEGIINAISSPIKTKEEVQRLCLLAVNKDKPLSEILSEAIFSVPVGGTIVVEDAPGVSSYVEFKSGFSLDGGFASSSLGGNLAEINWEAPQIALFKEGLSSVEDIVPVAEVASQWPHPLVIFTPYIEGDALKTMRMNPELNGQPWIAARIPPHWKFGEIWEKNLIALTGVTLIDKNIGNSPREFKSEWLGYARRVRISPRKTILTGNEEGEKRIFNRVEELKREIGQNESSYDRRSLGKQISMLSGGLCYLYLGGVTESDRKERRARVEDALFSVRAGIEGGIVPGGGSSFLTARDFILSRELGEGDFSYGKKAFCKALEAPVLKLLENSEMGPFELGKLDEERTKNYNPWLGWDVLSKQIIDCKEEGIWETKKGVLEILRGAVSVASVFLNSGAVVWKRKR